VTDEPSPRAELMLPVEPGELTPITLTGAHLPAETPRAPSFTAEEIDAIRANVEASDAENTKRAYTGAWASFVAYCNAHDATALPATPEALAGYLSHALRQDGKLYTVGTLNLHLSAIKRAHRERGLTPPHGHPLVYRVWKGIRRTRGTHQQGAPALTADLLAKAVKAIPSGPRGRRDVALLHVGFAGALRRSEIAALRLCDVVLHPRGVRLHVVRRKTGDDPTYVDVATGSPAAEALFSWLDVLATTTTPLSLEPEGSGTALFRAVHETFTGPRIAATGLSEGSVRDVVKRRTGLTAHSLRAGYATTAAELGQSLAEIRDAGGWKSIVTVDRYIRHRRQFGADAPRAKVQAALAAEQAEGK